MFCNFALRMLVPHAHGRMRAMLGQGRMQDAASHCPPELHRLVLALCGHALTAGDCLSLQVALKAADIGHLALPIDLHRQWVGRLQDEFFLLGDRERELGLAISPLMDRNKASTISNSQVTVAAAYARGPLLHAAVLRSA